MTNATSVLTSLLGAAVDYEKAEILALRWAGRWGDAPSPAIPDQRPPAVQQAEGRWVSPTQYTNAPPPRDPDEPPF